MTRGELARTAAEAACSVAGVAGLTGDPLIATLYPGGRVSGVRLTGDRIEVHVRVDRFPVEPVTRQVRAAVRAAAGDRPVDVIVDDVVLNGVLGGLGGKA